MLPGRQTDCLTKRTGPKRNEIQDKMESPCGDKEISYRETEERCGPIKKCYSLLLPQDLLAGCPRVPNEISVLACPELILSKAEAHSTFHSFIQQRVSRAYGSITSKLFHPAHKQIPPSMELGSLCDGVSGRGDMEKHLPDGSEVCPPFLITVLSYARSYPKQQPLSQGLPTALVILLRSSLA